MFIGISRIGADYENIFNMLVVLDRDLHARAHVIRYVKSTEIRFNGYLACVLVVTQSDYKIKISENEYHDRQNDTNKKAGSGNGEILFSHYVRIHRFIIS